MFTILQYFYTNLYNFYHNRLGEDDWMSWFYTVSTLGFLFALNCMSLVHFIFIWLGLFPNKVVYVAIAIIPWFSHFVYFYGVNKKRKDELLAIGIEISVKWKIYFVVYFILSQVLMFYTLILYANSTVS